MDGQTIALTANSVDGATYALESELGARHRRLLHIKPDGDRRNGFRGQPRHGGVRTGTTEQIVNVIGTGSRTTKQFLLNLTNPNNASIAMSWGFQVRATGVIQP